MGIDMVARGRDRGNGGKSTIDSKQSTHRLDAKVIVLPRERRLVSVRHLVVVRLVAIGIGSAGARARTGGGRRRGIVAAAAALAGGGTNHNGGAGRGRDGRASLGLLVGRGGGTWRVCDRHVKLQLGMPR